MLRISIGFIVGIYINQVCNCTIHVLLATSAIMFLFSIVLYCSRSNSKMRARLLSSLLLSMVLVFGMIRVGLKNISGTPTHANGEVNTEVGVVGKITEEIKENSRFSTVIDILSYDQESDRGRVFVYFSVKDSLIDYEKGDIIRIKGKIITLKDNANPMAFNYKDYLKFKGIERQVFLKEKSHHLVFKKKNSVFTITDQIRNWALGIFNKRLKNKDHLAVASAMVLGYREYLSKELYNTFSETGAVHVLAVSGLHVGIICMIFIALFNRWRNDGPLYKSIQFVVLLFVVWSYALITGGSPAVLRAAVMFTFLLIGRLWFRGANIYNILAFSALCLLIYNPYLLFQLSFQLSYLALISILFFQPIIERWWDTKHWIFTRLWQLTTVSIAAQILVFPISIYYFHSFPSYFILSGIAAVFLATFILVMGLMVLAFDSVLLIGDWCADLYCLLINLFVSIITSIQNLPFHSFDQIYFSQQSLITLYLGLGFIMFLINVKPRSYKDKLYTKVKRIRIAKVVILSCIIFLLVNNLAFSKRVRNNQKLIVYDIFKGSLIDVFIENTVYSMQSTELDSKKVSYAASSYRIYNGSKHFEELSLLDSIQQSSLKVIDTATLLFKNRYIVFMDKLDLVHGVIPCFSDILLVTNGTTQLPYDFLKVHTAVKVVLDNSLDYSVRNKWIKECKNRGISIHDIRKDGVFII
ncbi:MAG: ComEC/Rec2 family competence protein [Saprospiraceae bacterium]|nr:ComEC/Rec2 family competence protein [Saprospiraceae bacterium]